MKTRLLLLLLFSSFLGIAQIHVDQTATGTSDGSSWSNAYVDLNDAINAATNGAQIWVAGGTYKPDVADRASSFTLNTNNVSVYGGFNGTETMLSQRDITLNVTILSGDINGDDASVFSSTDPNRAENSYRIIEINGDGILIDGFSIVNANANGTSVSDQEGSAININTTGSLKIDNCKFMRHTLTRSGVIRSLDVANTVNIQVNNSIFEDNHAQSATIYYGRAGVTLTTKFEGCLFTKNTTSSTGNNGILIWLRQDTVGNHDVDVINCTFSNNTLGASAPVIGYLGSTNTLCNVYNSIFWNNTDTSGNTLNALQSGINGLVANNISNNGFPSITNTLNNLSSDPLFTDAANEDYTLQFTSPAINSGDSSLVSSTVVNDLAGNIRIEGASVDIGAYEVASSNIIVFIPDSNFKNYLLSQSAINTNGDTEIQGSEADAFSGVLNVTGLNINDLTGVDSFKDITELDASGNNLTSINISNNVLLTDLNVSNNNLTNLDISNNIQLTNLNASNNVIVSLDASNNRMLTDIDGSNNNLQTLNLLNGNTTSITSYNSLNNPSLTCVLVDDVIYASSNFTNKDNGTAFSVDCILPIYVNVNATGNNNGSSWADAYTNLSNALTQANNDQVLWVAQGIYKPGISRSTSFSFANSGLKVYGGFNGTEVLLSQRNHLINKTILSGDLSDNDDNSTLNFNNTTKADNSLNIARVTANNIELYGLVIDGGNANGGTTTTREGSALSFGSGITSFKMYDSEISNHINLRGGALRVTGSVTSDMRFQRIDFNHNLANFAACAYIIATTNGTNTVSFINSKFTDNETKDSPLGSGSAAIIWARDDFPTTRYNVTLTNCTVSNNNYQGAGNPTNGYPSFAATATGSGSSITVYNSIFSSNLKPGGDANSIGTFGSSNLPGRTVRNSFAKDAFGNVPDRANISNAAGGFTNAANGDYTLTATSTAVSFGDPQYLTGESAIFDLALNPRVSGTRLDIGAFEYQVLPQTFVDVLATGSNNGTSWADAYTDINTALTQNPGTEVWVKQGSYYPGNTTSSTILLTNEASVYGGFLGTETMRSQRDPKNNPTVFSGDVSQDDSGVVSLNNSTMSNNASNVFTVTGSNTVLDGVIVERGYGTQGSAITVGAVADNFRLVNSIVRENMSTGQGALSVSLFSTRSFTVDRTIFDSNIARVAADIYAANDNTSGMPSGTMTCNVINSLFQNSKLETGGTTAALDFGASVWFRNLFNPQDVNVINCTFSNISTELTSANPGNVIAVQQNNPTFNITDLEVYNSIFWNNTDGNGANLLSVGKQSSAIFPTNSSIENSLSPDGFSTWPNTANILTSNPMFQNSSSNNYRLTTGSPALDAGNNVLLISGGMLELDNKPRIFNTTVDMGAYEFDGITLNTEDINFNANSVRLYPNPTLNILNIDSNNQQIERVEIYDILGKQILKTNQTEINVSKLKEGIYILKVKTTLGEVVKRFIKK